MAQSSDASPSGGDNGRSEACRLAISTALKKVGEVCGDEEVQRQQMSRFMGVEPDADCDASLEEGLNAETLRDLRGLRQWVLCRVHNAGPDAEESLLQKHDGDFEAAVQEAWKQVDAARDEFDSETAGQA